MKGDNNHLNQQISIIAKATSFSVHFNINYCNTVTVMSPIINWLKLINNDDAFQLVSTSSDYSK